MKLLLIPDPTSPNGEDAFCREISGGPARAAMKPRLKRSEWPLEATLDT